QPSEESCQIQVTAHHCEVKAVSNSKARHVCGETQRHWLTSIHPLPAVVTCKDTCPLTFGGVVRVMTFLLLLHAENLRTGHTKRWQESNSRVKG
ncbi:mCG23563, partial [Mus musculus]